VLATQHLLGRNVDNSEANIGHMSTDMATCANTAFTMRNYERSSRI